MISNEQEQVPAIPSNLQTLAIIVAVAIICAVYISLSHWIGIDNYWPGFVFLLFWGGVEKLAVNKLVECAAGAVVGMSMGYLLQQLPTLIGVYGFVVFVVLICTLVFCQIKHWFVIGINLATMLYVTVTTIPVIQQHSDFTELYSALGVGVLFFGALGLIIDKVMSRQAASVQTS